MLIGNEAELVLPITINTIINKVYINAHIYKINHCYIIER